MYKSFCFAALACCCLGVHGEAPDWTGLRGGVSVGAAEHQSGWTSIEGFDPPTGSTNHLSLLSGVQVGYAVAQGSTILGVELSHEFGFSAKETQVGSRLYPFTRKDKLQGMTNLTLRWGLPKGNNLYFASVGVGLVNASHTFTPVYAASDAFTAKNHKVGAVLGVGFERQLNEDFSLRTELLHFEGPKSSYTNPWASDETYQTKERVDTVRVGLSYRF